MIIQIPDFCKECTEYPHCEAKFGTDAYACTDYNIATMHEIETHANMTITLNELISAKLRAENMNFTVARFELTYDNFNNIAKECRERNLKLGIRVVIRNENNLVLVKNSDVLETIRVLKMKNPNIAKVIEYNDNLIYGE